MQADPCAPALHQRPKGRPYPHERHEAPFAPEIPKVETGRQPEAVKGDARRLVEPSMDRPVDHVGRAGGNAEPMPVGAKPDATNPNPAKPPERGQPARKPDPAKVEPQPPKRVDAPPAPKPDGKPGQKHRNAARIGRSGFEAGGFWFADVMTGCSHMSRRWRKAAS
jgi:hypothetical protein